MKPLLHEENLRMVAHVARSLGDLVHKVVFLGGAVTELLITDPAAPAVRATRDVDIIVEIGSKTEYYQLADTLRDHRFHEDAAGDGPICRWKIDDVTVDVMPTSEEVLGFANRWYPLAIESASAVKIEGDLVIRVVTAPLFLATKAEAFLNRGMGDYLGSPDLEDIIAVIDGRREIVEEVGDTFPEVKTFIAGTFNEWLNERSFLDYLPGHLPADPASRNRISKVLDRMKSISALAP